MEIANSSEIFLKFFLQIYSSDIAYLQFWANPYIA